MRLAFPDEQYTALCLDGNIFNFAFVIVYSAGLADPNDDLYPAVGETVDRIACSANFEGVCCKEEVNIKIKNCKGLYYVYYLRPPTTCPSAFCFGTYQFIPGNTAIVFLLIWSAFLL